MIELTNLVWLSTLLVGVVAGAWYLVQRLSRTWVRHVPVWTRRRQHPTSVTEPHR